VKADATVAVWQTDLKDEPIMDAAGKPKPYIVRSTFGAGSVTWVAQDRRKNSSWEPVGILKTDPLCGNRFRPRDGYMCGTRFLIGPTSRC